MTKQEKQDRVWIILLCGLVSFIFMCIIAVHVFIDKNPSVAKARTYKEKYASCQNDNQQLRAQISQNQHMTIPPLLMK